MNVLLVNPWITDFKCYDFWIKPFGLLRIATLLKKYNFNVELIDCMDRFVEEINDKYKKEEEYGKGKYYYEEIKKPDEYKDIPRKYKRYGIPIEIFYKKLEQIKRPDLIIITSNMTYTYEGVFLAIKILKEKFPSTPLILGGIYATLSYEHAKTFSKANYVWRGNIDNSYLFMISKLTGVKLSPIEDIDFKELTPDYSFYKYTPYVAVRLTEGCPFNCTYCAIKQFFDNFYQRRIENVLNELELYHNNKIQNIAFYDDALFYKNFYIKEVLKKIIEKKYNFKFHTPNGLHARYIDMELAKLMKESGFVDIRVSLETSDYDLQKKTGGKVKKEELETAINNLRKAGFKDYDIGVYILAGIPEQSFNSVKKDIEYLKKLKLKIKLANYSPIPNTIDFLKLKPEIQHKLIKEPLLQNEFYFLTINTKYNWVMNEYIKKEIREYNKSLK